MKLVYKFKIKDNKELSKLCKISKNLYNQANYIVRQEFINNKKWIRYNDLNRLCKEIEEENNNYKKLKIQTSQQILRLLDKNWNSFFKSIKEWKRNKSKFKGKPNLPKYLKKDKHLLIFTNQNSKIKNNHIYLNKELKIRIPKYKDYKFENYQQIRILPYKNYYEVEILYNREIENNNLDYTNYISIDIGLNNLVSLVSKERTILFSGKIIKSINQSYNKYISKLKSIRDKKKKIKLNSNKLNILEIRRKYFIRDYFHKISRSIVNYCIKNKIGNLVVGLH